MKACTHNVLWTQTDFDLNFTASFLNSISQLNSTAMPGKSWEGSQYIYHELYVPVYLKTLFKTIKLLKHLLKKLKDEKKKKKLSQTAWCLLRYRTTF